MRNEEQMLAVSEFSAAELADLRRLVALDGESQGIDGITAYSCWDNGRDTCGDIGVTTENGFTDAEIRICTERYAVRTAKLFEVI